MTSRFSFMIGVEKGVKWQREAKVFNDFTHSFLLAFYLELGLANSRSPHSHWTDSSERILELCLLGPTIPGSMITLSLRVGILLTVFITLETTDNVYPFFLSFILYLILYPLQSGVDPKLFERFFVKFFSILPVLSTRPLLLFDTCYTWYTRHPFSCLSSLPPDNALSELFMCSQTCLQLSHLLKRHLPLTAINYALTCMVSL